MAYLRSLRFWLFILTFLSALGGVILIGRVVWAAQAADIRGEDMKVALRNLAILAVAYALGAMILGWGAQSGTSVKGIDKAINLR